MTLRRWASILVGFGGILVMVRPSTSAFQAAALVAIVATLFSALRDLLTRRISAVESSNLILLYSMIAAAITGALSVMVIPWRLPNALHFGLFVLNAALNGAAHMMMIESYRRAEASIVSPFRYTALVWAIAFGWMIWGDVPDHWLLVGAVIVIASGLYLFRLETRGSTNAEL